MPIKDEVTLTISEQNVKDALSAWLNTQLKEAATVTKVSPPSSSSYEPKTYTITFEQTTEGESNG